MEDLREHNLYIALLFSEIKISKSWRAGAMFYALSIPYCTYYAVDNQ